MALFGRLIDPGKINFEAIPLYLSAVAIVPRKILNIIKSLFFLFGKKKHRVMQLIGT